jgi:hypothetical protein
MLDGCITQPFLQYELYPRPDAQAVLDSWSFSAILQCDLPQGWQETFNAHNILTTGVRLRRPGPVQEANSTE